MGDEGGTEDEDPETGSPEEDPEAESPARRRLHQAAVPSAAGGTTCDIRTKHQEPPTSNPTSNINIWLLEKQPAGSPDLFPDGLLLLAPLVSHQ